MGSFPFLDVSRILFASRRVIPAVAVTRSFFPVMISLENKQNQII